jgi:hypothetical protein
MAPTRALARAPWWNSRPMMKTVAWAMVGLGILLAAAGAVPIVAWAARTNARVQSDTLLGHHLQPWAWPTVLVGV